MPRKSFLCVILFNCRILWINTQPTIKAVRWTRTRTCDWWHKYHWRERLEDKHTIETLYRRFSASAMVLAGKLQKQSHFFYIIASPLGQIFHLFWSIPYLRFFLSRLHFRLLNRIHRKCVLASYSLLLAHRGCLCKDSVRFRVRREQSVHACSPFIWLPMFPHRIYQRPIRVSIVSICHRMRPINCCMTNWPRPLKKRAVLLLSESKHNPFHTAFYV